MAKFLRAIFALIFAFVLGGAFPLPALASPLTPAELLPSASTAESIQTHQGLPEREDLNPSEPGFDDNTVSNQDGANWEPTADPKAQITPGEMRSDAEAIPGGFTKEQADQAELQEAQERSRQERQTFSLAAADTCRTYWPSPYKVCGAIREKYDSLGGPRSFLTWPKSDELGVPDGVGRRNEFINGFIYWHPKTGAHSVTTISRSPGHVLAGSKGP